MRNLSAHYRCFLTAWWEQQHYILSEDVFSLWDSNTDFSEVSRFPLGQYVWQHVPSDHLFLWVIYRRSQYLDSCSSTWGTRTPGERRRHLRGNRKRLTSTETKNRNRLNLELTPILALMNIRPRIEVLECQKQAQLSH
jgi:hypothetical protein